jgi:catechol 2,3-dioxygenase-like lactoylglutathione lyase family enzyme
MARIEEAHATDVHTNAFADEDVGNIVSLEHVNVTIPDQATATLFYILGMGFTRDPYLNVGLDNMWVNVGEQQFHLPTRDPQVIPGHIGIVVPSLGALRERLEAVQPRLAHTQFRYAVEEGYLAVTCPWGNQFRCYAPQPRFGDIVLGMPYVEFLTRPGTAAGIARFYAQVLLAPAHVEQDAQGVAAHVRIGTHQWLIFRETDAALRPYDGHHIAIYVANFSAPYNYLKARGLIMEDVTNHQFRFKDLVAPDSGELVFTLEHEVRSLRHPMYRRALVNRNPDQTLRHYRRGHDALIPFAG